MSQNTGKLIDTPWACVVKVKNLQMRDISAFKILGGHLPANVNVLHMPADAYLLLNTRLNEM